MIYDVRDIGFTYPSGTRKVLDGVSLTLERGEILSVLGPNGAGKSTLLNCMAGLLRPNSGRIYLDGGDLRTLSARQTAKVMAYVPQTHTPAFAYTVLHFVTMGRAPHIGAFRKPAEHDYAEAARAISALGIEQLADRPYTEISGGERQLATIARALTQQPKAILFDEPTANLDYGNQHRILRLIRSLSEKGYGIIITTHNPDHALLLGGKAAVLYRDGTLCLGACGEIITEERIREVYDTDLRLTYLEELGRVACVLTGLSSEASQGFAGREPR